MPFRTDTANCDLVGVGIDFTEVCNRRCPTCFAAHTPRHMERKTFQRIINEAVQLGFKELYILGGEPTIHPLILECLRYTEGKFGLVILVTNMDRLEDRYFCQAVEKTGVVIAGQRHTLGTSKESHQQERLLTGGNHLASSHQAWENVATLFPADRVCVQCCITQPVVASGDIFKVFQWCRRMGYEPVMEFTKEGGDFKRGCTLDISPEEMDSVLKEFQRIDREEFGLCGAELLSPQAYGKTCHMQENSIHFRVDGEVIPCVGFPGLSYGNIMETGLAQIIAYPLRSHIRDPYTWIYGYCRDQCLHFAKCTGGCRGSSFDMSGCYRASFYYCPHVPRQQLTLADMIPPTCAGCPLEGNPTCHPRR